MLSSLYTFEFCMVFGCFTFEFKVGLWRWTVHKYSFLRSLSTNSLPYSAKAAPSDLEAATWLRLLYFKWAPILKLFILAARYNTASNPYWKSVFLPQVSVCGLIYFYRKSIMTCSVSMLLSPPSFRGPILSRTQTHPSLRLFRPTRKKIQNRMQKNSIIKIQPLPYIVQYTNTK